MDRNRLVVMKFGGTSMGSADRKKRVHEAELRRLVDQALHVGEADCTARGVRARFGHAIATAQVAVVVGVDPQLPRKGGRLSDARRLDTRLSRDHRWCTFAATLARVYAGCRRAVYRPLTGVRSLGTTSCATR